MTVGPRLLTQWLPTQTLQYPGRPTLAVLPGLSVGVAIQVGELFSVLPEVTAVVPVVGEFANASRGTPVGTPVVQFKLGLQLGPRRAQ